MSMDLKILNGCGTNNRTIAVFIHGLGAPATWDEWTSILQQDNNLKGIDIGIVKYETAHMCMPVFPQKWRVSFSIPLLGKRIALSRLYSVEELAHFLKIELESKLSNYDKIILIGHSMGGLIGGYYLLRQVESKEKHNVIGFISVASPFAGSTFASYFKMLQKNNQVEGLAPNSHFLKNLRERWERNKYLLVQNACIAFAFASEDIVVGLTSAVPKVSDSRWSSLILSGGHASVLTIKEGIQSKTYQYISGKIKGFANTPQMMPITRSRDILTLDEYWEKWANNTKPNLKEDLFLIGRATERDHLKGWIETGKDNIFIVAETKEEAVLTFIATARLMEGEIKESTLGLTYIVFSLTGWNSLVNVASEVTLIPLFKIDKTTYMPRNCRVAIPLGKNDIKPQKNKIEFKKQNSQQFIQAMTAIGVNSKDQYGTMEKTNRNIIALCRRISSTIIHEPSWIKNANKNQLVPALLVGKWHEHYDGDKQVIQEIANKKYENINKDMICWQSCEETPLMKTDDCYQWIVLDDGWEYVFESITESDLQRFKTQIKVVFKEMNPKFELAEEQWFAANVHGKESTYSDDLMSGLATSLILLAMRDQEGNNFNVRSTQGYVNAIVTEIFDETQTWQQWFSIAPYLELFAEASPEVFLDKIDKQILTKNRSFMELFKKMDANHFQKQYYTHVLWCLEILAWNREYTSRCCKILANLAGLIRKDNKSGNSPVNSLYHILLTWKPQTMLESAERMEVLEMILRENDAVGWDLLKMLLPKRYQVSHENAKPKWREWEIDYDREISREEIFEQKKYISMLIIEAAKNTPERWVFVIENLENLELEKIQDVAGLLISDKSQFDPDNQMLILTALRATLNKHRHFATAEWCMSEEKLNILQCAYHAYEPQEVTKKHLFLFEEYCPKFVDPEVYDPANKNQMENEQRRVLDSRKTAVEEIYRKYGEDGLKNLLDGSIDNAEIGAIIAGVVHENAIDWEFITSISKDKPNMVRGYLHAISREKGFSAIAKEVDDAKEAIGFENFMQILLLMPSTMTTWQLVEKLEVDDAKKYWNHCQVDCYNNEDFEYLVDKLIYNNRPYSALNLLGYKGGISSDLYMKVLEGCFSFYPQRECNEKDLESVYYLISEALMKLQNIPEVDKERVAKLELLYLPMLQDDFEPKMLNDEIRNNPTFFVELICNVYKSEDQTGNITLTQEEENLLYLSRKLLRSIKFLPGFEHDKFDQQHFHRWLDTALEKLKETKRTKIGEQIIGEVLSYSPDGADGNWPHEYVRDFIENHYTEHIKEGLIVGVLKQRGVYYGTGGVEEQSLAQKYKNYADDINIRWPRGASILRNISQAYYQDYLREREEE